MHIGSVDGEGLSVPGAGELRRLTHPDACLTIGHHPGPGVYLVLAAVGVSRRVKCYQCPAPAMYQVGEQNIPLCLNCYSKLAHVEQQQLESHERMLNYLSDEMAFTVGMPSMGPRFPPRPKPVHIGDVRLNNISVSNSVVGTINTGSIGSLDQSISALVQLNEPQLAQAFKELSEAILQSGDLTKNQRNELIEALNVISREAATPPETRQNTVALSLLERAEKITSMATDISELCQRYWPAIAAVFASVSG